MYSSRVDASLVTAQLIAAPTERALSWVPHEVPPHNRYFGVCTVPSAYPISASEAVVATVSDVVESVVMPESVSVVN